jgi:small subunit ribosomal protein S17
MADERDEVTIETAAPPAEEAQASEDAVSTVEDRSEVDQPDAAESAVPEQPAAEKPAPPEPAEQLSPKERRRRARSTRAGQAREPRSAAERQAERTERRRAKALRRRARRLQERAKAAQRRTSAPPLEDLAPVHAPTEGTRRVRQGVVVSNKADKTITVRIDIARRHRRYEKVVRSSSTLHAHDEHNEAHEGDVVRVIESRPLSRSKRWRLVDVLERAR